ncbi:hypothetical protein CSHISOI_02495 [Colletotrichum shisoi]|uniref:Uncharacterized protein n=1 Tax=Colletotrichum shisoi TaxID=2078593 RepID=A0A5Q4C386_9PEZI|nr:hypothetical protein CSHISOI_02495 [Colletotrichum shisoi]
MKFSIAATTLTVLGLVANTNGAPTPKNLAIEALADGNSKIADTLSMKAPASNPDAPTVADGFVQNESRAICQHRAYPVSQHYSVLSSPGMARVEDIAAVCGRLWRGLHHHAGCAAITEPSCGEHEYMEGVLEWHFSGSSFCNVGMVESAWWEATHNDHGRLECRDV